MAVVAAHAARRFRNDAADGVQQHHPPDHRAGLKARAGDGLLLDGIPGHGAVRQPAGRHSGGAHRRSGNPDLGGRIHGGGAHRLPELCGLVRPTCRSPLRPRVCPPLPSSPACQDQEISLARVPGICTLVAFPYFRMWPRSAISVELRTPFSCPSTTTDLNTRRSPYLLNVITVRLAVP
jgi:hypothetical protein